MTVVPISEEIEFPELAEQLRGLTMAPEPKPKPPKALSAQVIQIIQALAAAVAIRVVLALVAAGAFWLAYMAVQAHDDRAIWVLGVYTLTVVGPVVWLASRKT